MNTEMPRLTFLKEEETKETSSYHQNKSGWVLVNGKYFYPPKYSKLCSFYYNFNVKPDDLWIISFPRSGTTLTQEMIWLLSNGMNFEVAKSVLLDDRFPFLEQEMTIDAYLKNSDFKASKINAKNELLTTMSSPRFIKTHFPLSLLPNVMKSNCKVIYVARNPKDVAISNYHLGMNAGSCFKGSFENYWHTFQNNQVWWGPYSEHIKEAWAERDNPNLLFLFYEEIVADLPSTMRKMSKFLGKSYSDEQFSELEQHLQFSSFKNNKMVNGEHLWKKGTFIRQGKSQAWQDTFTPELNTTANQWIEENFSKTDLKFPFVDVFA